MDLQKIVVLCLVLVVVGGAAWYLTGQNDGSNQTGETTGDRAMNDTNNNGVENEPLSGFGSFTTLLGLGQNITCNYSFSDADGNSGSGTGYFADGRMRVDSVMTSEGQTFDSHIINDGQFIYTWTTSSEEEFAMKMAVPEETAATDYEYPEEMNRDQKMVDTNQEVEYDCDRWRVDTSVFTPPSDVEFMDMAAMMQEAFGNMPEGFEMPEGFRMPQ